MERTQIPTISHRWLLLTVLIIYGFTLFSGCAPKKYIYSADKEALNIIDDVSQDSRWLIADYRFLPDLDSRLYVDFYQETPCQPQDDPASHEYMKCVYGYRGWKGWDKYGYEVTTDSRNWLNYMESDNGTVVIDRTKAIELALKHSRDYQQARENLYLCALSVTEQRFNLDVQAAYTASSTTQTDFEGYNSETLSQKGTLKKATAAGGTILANLANTIVWTFSGDGTSHIGTTVLSYSLVQPLLQYAGRAYALENLTQAERNLLANVRRMEQYRQGFYISIVAGSSSLTIPSSGSVSISNSRISYGSVGGFYGLLRSQMALANQRANVESLKDSLDRMQANCDANRITSFQVDQTRQSLYQSQLSLLSLQNTYTNSVDQFKITLGLPPELQVEIRDPLLDSFELIDVELKALQKRTEKTVVEIRSGELKGEPLKERIEDLIKATTEQTQLVRNDVQALIDIAPKRRAILDQWASQKDRWGKEMDLSIFDSKQFDQRVENIVRDAKISFEQVKKYSTELKKLNAGITATDCPEELDDMVYAYNGVLLELILVQGRARLDSITLQPIYMDPECAISVAMTRRLDWMNARAALVDKWRQIEIAKNALKAGLKVTFDGNMTTTDLRDAHGSTTSLMKLGLQFDAPLNRLKERNAYRRALLSYYQAHRSFIEYEDNARENIREIIRKIDLCQMSFELQRASVLVAMSQYDQRRLQLERPPKPNETSSFGDSFARDLIDALNSLLTSQNQIMNEWLQYEAMRMVLDYALGTMKIDECGQWIDPGSMDGICPAPDGTQSVTAQQDSEQNISQLPETKSVLNEIINNSVNTVPTTQQMQTAQPVVPTHTPVQNPVPATELNPETAPIVPEPSIPVLPSSEPEPAPNPPTEPEMVQTPSQVSIELEPIPEVDVPTAPVPTMDNVTTETK